MKSITVSQLKELSKTPDTYVFVDVRTPSEFKSERIPFFINIPLPKIEEFCQSLKKDQTLVVSCHSGMRSAKAAQLVSESVSTIYNVEGGLQAWKQASFETIQEQRGGISIMRQVQLVIGTGSLIGIILSVYINPMFLWVPAFFASGLIFAGLSNTCGLAIFLGYMPWNK